MNDGRKSKRVALNRLSEELVEDILSCSDAEILAEAREDGIDLAATVAHMRSIYERALVDAGKSRLAAAKAAVQADSAGRTGTVVSLDPSAARVRLKSIFDQRPDVYGKLTFAARKEEELSDADVLGMLEEMAELGILPPDDNEDSNT